MSEPSEEFYPSVTICPGLKNNEEDAQVVLRESGKKVLTGGEKEMDQILGMYVVNVK